MARPRSSSSNASASSTAHLGFDAKLWLAADNLRSNMDAAEYKHVVLGLIFLKYISDTFEEHRAKLVAGNGDYKGSNPEDPDEYHALAAISAAKAINQSTATAVVLRFWESGLLTGPNNVCF